MTTTTTQSSGTGTCIHNTDCATSDWCDQKEALGQTGGVQKWHIQFLDVLGLYENIENLDAHWMKLSTISHILTIFSTKYPRLAPKSKNHVTSIHINSQIIEKTHEKNTKKREQPWNNHQKCVILPFYSHLFAGLRDVVGPTSRLPLALLPAQRLHWFHHRRNKHQEWQRTMGLKATIVDIYNNPWRIHGAAIYSNMDPINIPQSC